MNWMVNPDQQLATGKVQNLAVLGWAIVRTDGKLVQRVSLELFKPTRIPAGCQAWPLTAVELCPEQATQPNHEALIATCRRNLAMNVNSVPARFVLAQLGEAP